MDQLQNYWGKLTVPTLFWRFVILQLHVASGLWIQNRAGGTEGNCSPPPPHHFYQHTKENWKRNGQICIFYFPPSLQNASGVVSNIARSSPGLHKYKEIRLFTKSNVHGLRTHNEDFSFEYSTFGLGQRIGQIYPGAFGGRITNYKSFKIHILKFTYNFIYQGVLINLFIYYDS